MSGKAATVMAVGWMSVCGGLALATMDNGLWRAMSGHSSVHYLQELRCALSDDAAAGCRPNRRGGPDQATGLLDLIKRCLCLLATLPIAVIN